MKRCLIIFILLLCSNVYAGVVLNEGGFKENLEVVKIYSDKVLVNLGGSEAFIREDQIVNNIKLLSIQYNSMDNSLSKAVFDFGVEEVVEEKTFNEVITLNKNSGEKVFGDMVVFVKATDNVAFMSINGKEYSFQKDKPVVISGLEFRLISLMHNVIDDSHDKVSFRVVEVKGKREVAYMGSITGDVVKDYSLRSYNSVKKMPITGRVVERGIFEGGDLFDASKKKGLGWFWRMVNWMLGRE